MLGFGGGPPCETWTAARFLPGGPPPVRSFEQPWGLCNLAPRAHLQVWVGTVLLQFLLGLMIFSIPYGTCSFLEHPSFPVWLMRCSPPSVWCLSILSQLVRLQCVQIVSFDQCVFGCEGKKPTTLCWVRLPAIRRAALARGHGGRCHHAWKHAPLSGRSETGFNTAKAKIYPAELNWCVAEGVRQFILCRNLQTNDDLPSDLALLNSDVFAELDQVQPDFHL